MTAPTPPRARRARSRTRYHRPHLCRRLLCGCRVRPTTRLTRSTSRTLCLPTSAALCRTPSRTPTTSGSPLTPHSSHWSRPQPRTRLPPRSQGSYLFPRSRSSPWPRTQQQSQRQCWHLRPRQMGSRHRGRMTGRRSGESSRRSSTAGRCARSVACARARAALPRVVHRVRP
jgi:hypothetical protein